MAVAWGFLSTANINRKVLAGARKSDRVDVVAVGSRDKGRAEQYAREHEIERAYGSYEALLEDTEVEAIYISLPNSMHIEWSVRCLEAGKHVLCEKPLTRRTDEAEAAFDAADRADRLLSEAFMYRHNPQTLRLKELVDEGAIGELQLIRSAFSFTVDGPTNVRMLPDLGGGSLMDVGCYCVSGSRLLAGDPSHVFAEQIESETGVDLRLSGTMVFPANVIGQFDSGLSLPDRDELEAIGSEGSLFVDDPWHVNEPLIELRRDGDTEEIRVEKHDSYRLELENLSDAIRGEAQLLLGRDDAVTQARVIEALYRSAEAGTPVDV